MRVSFLQFLCVLLLGFEAHASCGSVPEPMGPFTPEMERLTCELELETKCRKHFRRDFERDLYMKSCAEPSFLRRYVIDPVTPTGTAYCALMFGTDVVDLVMDLGEAGVTALVTAWTWAKNSSLEEIADRLTLPHQRLIQLSQESARCAASRECRQNAVQEFRDGLGKGMETSRKAIRFLMGAAREEAARQVEYWDCLTPAAQDAHVCAVVAGIFIPATKISLILKARGLSRVAETSEKITERVQDRVNGVSAGSGAAQRRLLSRQEFLERWRSSVATTPAENRAWIARSLAPKRAGEFYLDTQNTALKKLNDELKDKALVDAIGNRYNASVRQVVEQLKREHPELEVNFYSDYKSVRASIRGPPAKERELQELLAQRLKANDEAFQRELISARYVRAEDMQTPWFRSGLGGSADEANLATRFARRAEDNRVQSFTDPQIRQKAEAAWREAEVTRRLLQSRIRHPSLMDDLGNGRTVPKADVLDVVRKSKTPEEAREVIRRRYGISLEQQDVNSLRTYFEQIDQFSPGLNIPERVAHNFAGARQGGFTIDFAGVGAKNAEGTARGMAQATDLDGAIRGIRQQELRVTRELDALKEATRRDVEQVLSRHQIQAQITVSGDDMVVIPNSPLSSAVKRELMQAQARTGSPASLRTSFFPAGMTNEAQRVTQATIGESIEKKIRQGLEGRIPRQELQNLSVGIDMRGSVSGSGAVGLELSSARNLSAHRRRQIEEEFKKAVEAVNQELRSKGESASLSALP